MWIQATTQMWFANSMKTKNVYMPLPGNRRVQRTFWKWNVESEKTSFENIQNYFNIAQQNAANLFVNRIKSNGFRTFNVIKLIISFSRILISSRCMFAVLGELLPNKLLFPKDHGRSFLKLKSRLDISKLQEGRLRLFFILSLLRNTQTKEYCSPAKMQIYAIVICFYKACRLFVVGSEPLRVAGGSICCSFSNFFIG